MEGDRVETSRSRWVQARRRANSGRSRIRHRAGKHIGTNEHFEPVMVEDSNTRAIPPELADAMTRIEQAKQDYVRFLQEIEVYLYNYVRGMVKGFDLDSGNLVLRMRHPKESNITGTPRVLVAQIVEHLRTALDYMVFALSEMSELAIERQSAAIRNRGHGIGVHPSSRSSRIMVTRC